MSGGIDTTSSTWIAIRDHVRNRLETNRNLLESLGQDAATTEQLRGAIDELRRIEAMAEPNMGLQDSTLDVE